MRPQFSTSRSLPTATTFVVLLSLGAPAVLALNESIWSWQASVTNPAFWLLLLSAFMLLVATSARHFNLVWAVYWGWSFTFLGLAVHYQLARKAFPWGGLSTQEAISEALIVLLVGHVAVILGYLLAKRTDTPAPSAYTDLRLPTAERTASRVERLLTIHTVIALVFIAAMNDALFSGRAVFRSTLVELSEVPAFGTVYFISTAGAIIMPAMAMTLKRRGLPISSNRVAISLAVSVFAVNPLLGSRFLTGSLLLAIAAATVGPRARRLLPLGLVVALVTVFPTLDIYRGDATGSTGVVVAPPSESVLSFDYDAFEMLTRAIRAEEVNASFGPSSAELLIAPFLRWIPFVSDLVAGDASGPAVAKATGMTFTNVSMPLWGEAYLIGGWLGLIAACLALGVFLRRSGGDNPRSGLFGVVTASPVAALMVIVLRGSLYEVLGYLLLAATVGWWINRAHRMDSAPPAEPSRNSRRQFVTLGRR